MSVYASVEDLQKRCKRNLSEAELSMCETLLEDAGVIIDSYKSSAYADAKKLVTCSMILRVLGDGETQFPIGATQGTVSALGYSQTFSMGTGSTGELYLTKQEKRLLGAGQRIGFASPWDDDSEGQARKDKNLVYFEEVKG